MHSTASRQPSILIRRMALLEDGLPWLRSYRAYAAGLQDRLSAAGQAGRRLPLSVADSPLSVIWPCSQFSALACGIGRRNTTAAQAVRFLFRDAAMAAHIAEGRQMARELRLAFGEKLPLGLVRHAAAYDRFGLLRSFEIRINKDYFTQEELTIALEMEQRLSKLNARLADVFATEDIAWPCPNCGELMLDPEMVFCSPGCRQQFERHERYRKTRGRRTRNARTR